MEFTFAVIADTHLPSIEGTAQYASFEWAINNINEKKPSFAVVAGDLTAAGDISSFDAFSERIKNLNVPCHIVLGNADMRTPANIEYARKLRTGYTIETSDRKVVCLNTPDARIEADDRATMDECGDCDILIMHHSLEGLDEDSRAFITAWAEKRHGVIIHAHSHRNRDYFIENTHVFGIRCLDPDKSVEKEPCLSYFTVSDNDVILNEVLFDFPCDNLKDFREKIGISCFDIYNDIDFATENNVKNIEIRKFDGSDEELEFLIEKVSQWRENGGQIVSVHMPNLRWNGEGMDGLELWEKAIRIVKEVGAETVTIHPPRAVRIGDMSKGSTRWNYLVDYFFDRISELPESTKAGIENIHAGAKEKDDDERFFGFTPPEILGFVDSLNEKFGFERVGVVFDIGHARNNGPHGVRNTIGVWEKSVGSRTTAYHIHQVSRKEDKMANHTAIENWGGAPYICFTTFLWSWQTGVINHKPMFMEMRHQDNCKISLDSLSKYFKTRFNMDI